MKINQSNTETKKSKETKQKLVPSIKDKDTLTVSETALFLGISRRTVYRWLDDGTIKGTRFSNNKVLFLKEDLLSIFRQNEAYERPTPTERKPITEFYTIEEVQEKYNIGTTWVFKIIRENNIPKTKIGGKTHVSKKHIDSYFKKKRDDVSTITEWYTVKEVQEKYNLSRDQVYNRVHENAIPKERKGKFVQISKQHFDELFIIKQ
ncbi:helix-turn-helix domain-containing protein [Maribellus sp. YY47]|uniref:helix-turn-helix domain-containing protein n=1 Tax=Maribellus sp. YY47 TaxID=2929486 RepID=UPI002000786D|nr:helix-turn-helix domain-containing protein [Maribellus sp. YY47]